MKICAVYKITNTITGDFYIGSSKNVKKRWADHKCQSTWNKHPNNQMYQDMQKYGVDNFTFEILAEVEVDKLKEAEQHFIETLKPIYNSNRAKGFDFERYKETQKEYRNVHKEYNKEYQKEYRNVHKEYNKEYQKEYQKSNKYKEYQKEYKKSNKYKEYQKSNKYKEYQKEYRNVHKEYNKEYQKQYNNQLCLYNGETLTLCALRMRFKIQGIDHPTAEAKKYLIEHQ